VLPTTIFFVLLTCVGSLSLSLSSYTFLSLFVSFATNNKSVTVLAFATFILSRVRPYPPARPSRPLDPVRSIRPLVGQVPIFSSDRIVNANNFFDDYLMGDKVDTNVPAVLILINQGGCLSCMVVIASFTALEFFTILGILRFTLCTGALCGWRRTASWGGEPGSHHAVLRSLVPPSLVLAWSQPVPPHCNIALFLVSLMIPDGVSHRFRRWAYVTCSVPCGGTPFDLG
jgi:hypothetical protein